MPTTVDAPELVVTLTRRQLDQFDLDFDPTMFETYGGDEIVTDETGARWRIEVHGAPEAAEYVADLLGIEVYEAAA